MQNVRYNNLITEQMIICASNFFSEKNESLETQYLIPRKVCIQFKKFDRLIHSFNLWKFSKNQPEFESRNPS